MTILDMADPQFRSRYCCAIDDDCAGEQMFNCDRTGFYGAYLLPRARVETDASGTPAAITVAYTLSSFSPYNVGLYETTFAIE